MGDSVTLACLLDSLRPSQMFLFSLDVHNVFSDTHYLAFFFPSRASVNPVMWSVSKSGSVSLTVKMVVG